MERREIASFNAIRGIAALAVCASHLRTFVFVPFTDTVGVTRAGQAFYFLTGLGREAVIVFFVMSGWLVGSSVWQQNLSGRFSWRNYAVARLSRLWVVLIPALAFTLVLDSVGIWLSGGIGYDGSIAPGPEKPMSLSPLTALGNVFFLQTILVPVFGTNRPLWSLSYEFWYYAIFPLLALAWHKRGSLNALWYIAAGIAILALLPKPVQSGFAVWLLGWIGSTVYQRVNASLAKPLCALSFALLVAALVASKSRASPSSAVDLGIAIAVTGLLLGLRALPDKQPRLQWMRSLFSRLADMSYSLYLFHFPLLACFFFSLHLHPQAPGWRAYAEFTVVLLAVLAIARGLWYLFERNTDSVRRLFGRGTVRERPIPRTA
jgi:peptidoglycan/LPS O-acetylase OafA/YrhL